MKTIDLQIKLLLNLLNWYKSTYLPSLDVPAEIIDEIKLHIDRLTANPSEQFVTACQNDVLQNLPQKVHQYIAATHSRSDSDQKKIEQLTLLADKIKLTTTPLAHLLLTEIKHLALAEQTNKNIAALLEALSQTIDLAFKPVDNTDAKLLTILERFTLYPQLRKYETVSQYFDRMDAKLNRDEYTDAEVETKLMQCAELGLDQCMQALLLQLPPAEREAASNIHDKNGCMLLHHSARSGNPFCVRVCLLPYRNDEEIKAAVQKTDQKGWSTLQHAARGHSVLCMSYLIHFLPTPAERFKFVTSHEQSVTPVIHICAAAGLISGVKLLVNTCEDEWQQMSLLTSRDSEKRSLSHFAAWGGCLEVLELSVSTYSTEKFKRGMLQMPDESGKPPLHYAAVSGDEACFNYLLQQYETPAEKLKAVQQADKYDETAFHAAARNGHVNIMKLILQLCNSDNERNHIWLQKATYNRTVLHFACDSRKKECIQFTYQHYKRLVPDVVIAQLADRSGKTPLHTALFDGDLELVEFILGELPNDEARLKAIRQPGQSGATALHEAALGTNPRCMQFLLSYYPDEQAKKTALKQTTAYQSTSLHDAAETGSPDVVKLILSVFIDKDELKQLLQAKNQEQRTAIQLAVDRGRWQNVKVLFTHYSVDEIALILQDNSVVTKEKVLELLKALPRALFITALKDAEHPWAKIMQSNPLFHEACALLKNRFLAAEAAPALLSPPAPLSLLFLPLAENVQSTTTAPSMGQLKQAGKP